MVIRKFPFPAGSPKEEIAFLIEFVNGDWEVFASDSMTEVFYYVHTSDGRPITRDVVAALRDEARAYLQTVASKRRPRIAGLMYEATDRLGRRRRVVPEGDFSARVRAAARHLLELRRAIRECRICDDFFSPHGRDPYCDRCRGGMIAEALRKEQAQQRKQRCRERQRVNEQNEHARLIELIARRPTAAARRRLAELDERCLALDRNYHPLPTPPIATWEMTVQIGVRDSDVQVQIGSLSAIPFTAAASECNPVTVMASSGTYQELLEKYRAERLKGRRFTA